MRFLKNIANYVVYSNLLIAFCASSLCYFSILFFDLSDYIYETITFVFFSTLFTYAFHRKIDHLYYGNRELTKQDLWINQNNNTYNLILIVSFIGSFYCFTLLPKSTSYILFPLLLISLLYIIKFNFGINISGLRSIPFLKPFLIAFVWGGISSFLPIVNNLGMSAIFETKYHLFALSMGLFVFGQAIPFDIRDFKLDQSSKLKTIPHLIGNKHTKRLSYTAYIISLFLIYLVSIEINFLFIALILAFATSSLIIWKLSENKSDLHFSLIHESSLAFPLICLKILSFF